MQGLRVTTSWDDGHPLDLRIADELASHGMQGTFYVPLRNSEGRAVMDAHALRQLAASFEIGGHTHDHVRLARLPLDVARAQIADGKAQLEDILGREVVGFCYPGGAYTPAIRELVRSLGFAYARTTENLRLDADGDPYQLPTTVQLYRHARRTYLKNYARRRNWRARATALGTVLRAGRDIGELVERLLEHAAAGQGVLHVWGHSWELEEQQLWPVLARVLRAIARTVPADARVTNAVLVGDAARQR